MKTRCRVNIHKLTPIDGTPWIDWIEGVSDGDLVDVTVEVVTPETLPLSPGRALYLFMKEGRPVREWDEQPEDVRRVWEARARAVLEWEKGK